MDISSDGFKQQTFLGASIRSFSLGAGYGDSSSTLSVELINDEYNKSDGKPRGQGDDVYHDGIQDEFKPPQAGSPVFFKFGKSLASVQDAYTKVFDDIYNYNIATDNNIPGSFHLTFGGILQSYIQNRGAGGNPLYSVQVVDPREILANTTLILNNYAGTTFNNANMYNIYGFLEYNRSQKLVDEMERYYFTKNIFQKRVNTDGSYYYAGNDMYLTMQSLTSGFVQTVNPQLGKLPIAFPITGTGFARRCNQGIPFYRIKQGLNTLLGIYGDIPDEYKNAGFGGYINFRGYNYVVDLSGLKTVSDYYFFDFDQINLLDFCLELCDITSSQLLVSLLPIIDHPACEYFYKWNDEQIQKNATQNIIAGIIRVDSIDKSFQPEYGAIKSYIDKLAEQKIYVNNQDVGFELSNVTTDKFIVGAQEVDMYFFSNNADRDELETRKQKHGLPNKVSSLIEDQWRLETSFKQQILPYYGLLANKAVTIPKGFGAYQQIMLDSTGLSANGVGNYYVATELELRAALISYDTWVNFLLEYNDKYLESVEENDSVEGQVLDQTVKPDDFDKIPVLSRNYAVSVPRSVFTTDKPGYGEDGLPLSPCNPPYGYPLYYKRATKIGIPEAVSTRLTASNTKLLSNVAAFSNSDDGNFRDLLNSQWKDAFSIEIKDGVQAVVPNPSRLTTAELEYFTIIAKVINDSSMSREDAVGLLENINSNLSDHQKVISAFQKESVENAKRVYNFLKKIADECLGRKFLVKIPREANLFYDKQIYTRGTRLITIADSQEEVQQKLTDSILVNEIEYGPFGFKPRVVHQKAGYEFLDEFQTLIEKQISENTKIFTGQHTFHGFLTKLEPNPKVVKGALDLNYNPLIDDFEFNYEPEKQGGYIEFDLFANLVKNDNLAINQGLLPKDLTNFIQNNNRLSAYVRFDNSQDLSLDLLTPDSFSQQSVVAGQFIPDLSESLDNIKQENNGFQSFESNANTETNKNKQVAFVKCDIDDKFYMPPKSEFMIIGVHGTKVRDIGAVSLPRRIKDCSGKEKTTIPYYQSIFVPDVNGFTYTYNKVVLEEDPNMESPGSRPVEKIVPVEVGVERNAKILDFYRGADGLFITDTQYLDTDNVYALITLPSRILPTKDARFRDSTFQKYNPALFKHFMRMDVVKIREFDIPAFFDQPTDLISNGELKSVIDPGNVINAVAAAKKAIESQFNFGLANRIKKCSPSPIYPDLVVLPLLSKERCYGPWVSSQIDSQASVYSNIGGRIEFIKDENLSPWNFNGYDLMNQAGILQAEFSNSLLLQSERGGFVVPDAPSGIALGKFLANAGPLITNINVDVGDNGVQTTYKLDLYTASFGKLQKQKQDAISNISRERQKLKDEINSLIRKGFGKNQKNINFELLHEQIKNMSIRDPADEDTDTSKYAPAGQVSMVRRRNILGQTFDEDQNLGQFADGPFAAASNDSNVAGVSYDVAASQTSHKDMAFMLGHTTDRLFASKASYNSAFSETGDTSYPLAMEPGHPNMPYVEAPRDNSSLYGDNLTDITTFG